MATLDQQQTTSNDGQVIRASSSALGLGQSFVPSVTADIYSIKAKPYKDTAISGNIWIELWSDSAGSPGTKLATSTTTFNVSTFSTGENPGTAVEREFVFAAGNSLTSGTTYWFVINGDWALSNSIYAAQAGSNPYASGTTKQDNSVTWTERATYDCYFREYYAAAAGPANIKTVDGLVIASVKTINGLAIASVKNVNGLA